MEGVGQADTGAAKPARVEFWDGQTEATVPLALQSSWNSAGDGTREPGVLRTLVETLPGAASAPSIRVVRKAVSGISIGTVLRTLFPEAVTAYATHGWAKPGYVVIMIGENEMQTSTEADNFGTAADNASGELGQLCDAIEAWAPGVRILIMESPIEHAGSYPLSARIRATQAAVAAAGLHRTLVSRAGVTMVAVGNPHYDLAGYATAGTAMGAAAVAMP